MFIHWLPSAASCCLACVSSPLVWKTKPELSSTLLANVSGAGAVIFGNLALVFHAWSHCSVFPCLPSPPIFHGCDFTGGPYYYAPVANMTSYRDPPSSLWVPILSMGLHVMCFMSLTLLANVSGWHFHYRMEDVTAPRGAPHSSPMAALAYMSLRNRD